MILFAISNDAFNGYDTLSFGKKGIRFWLDEKIQPFTHHEIKKLISARPEIPYFKHLFI
ncbi:hypothetical protein [Fluviispira sanaruensis]|uniref:Uncharacterized protein n=1 Tax=Fluviispira sanaruensis TaxID=2493639 RepID=A0A4P2VIV9_FLUSA|nr:hypothetical protein [Fluviispira sanaruensis]BBH53026.1 hypothetical protein JCM31447_14690 [Fluviispira sanaruensis]